VTSAMKENILFLGGRVVWRGRRYRLGHGMSPWRNSILFSTFQFIQLPLNILLSYPQNATPWHVIIRRWHLPHSFRRARTSPPEIWLTDGKEIST
jgi:hypothetical protein